MDGWTTKTSSEIQSRRRLESPHNKTKSDREKNSPTRVQDKKLCAVGYQDLIGWIVVQIGCR